MYLGFLYGGLGASVRCLGYLGRLLEDLVVVQLLLCNFWSSSTRLVISRIGY